MLIEHFARFTVTNSKDDVDGLKHLPEPPCWASEIGKVVFVSGECVDVYKSIKRRGWVDVQGAKLGSVIAAVFPGAVARWAFMRAVERQIAIWDRWCSLQPDRRLFISYGEIWQRLNEISEFCEIKDDNFVRSFPERVRRRS